MNGTLLLEGGAEFGGRMAEPDRRALELAGGAGAALVVIAAAAAPDNNHARAGGNALRWFRSLGAQNAVVSALTDSTSADSTETAAELAAARFIYMLGGFPGHLCLSLAGSRGWQAVLQAYQSGAVVGGSSAGAMVLGEYLYDPGSRELLPGLGLLPGALVIPHHNSFGRHWGSRLTTQLPMTVLVGIDERTGLLDDAPGGRWRVYGQGAATIYAGGEVRVFRSGESFALPSLGADSSVPG